MENRISRSEGGLPASATNASRRRYELARELVERYPPQLASEIALTGSASRGGADADSDIELALWSASPVPREMHDAWLLEAGAIDLAPETHTTMDGTVWHWSRYRGVWLETGLQTVDAVEGELAALCTGTVTEHGRFALADGVLHSIPLRTEGRIEAWKQQLGRYPASLQENMIRVATRRWHYAIAYWGLARRGDRVGATVRLLADVQSVLRIVFAVNSRWEPPWKWLRLSTGELPVKPVQLMERIDAILRADDLEASCKACAELFAETLTLVPGDIDVSVALANIQASLRDRAP